MQASSTGVASVAPGAGRSLSSSAISAAEVTDGEVRSSRSSAAFVAAGADGSKPTVTRPHSGQRTASGATRHLAAQSAHTLSPQHGSVTLEQYELREQQLLQSTTVRAAVALLFLFVVCACA